MSGGLEGGERPGEIAREQDSFDDTAAAPLGRHDGRGTKSPDRRLLCVDHEPYLWGRNRAELQWMVPALIPRPMLDSTPGWTPRVKQSRHRASPVVRRCPQE